VLTASVAQAYADLTCAYLVRRLLAGHETPTRRLPVDGAGLALLVVWVGALQIMLDKGKDLDWFGSPVIRLLALVAAVGFMLFVIWELTDKAPIVDLFVFRRRGFTVGAVVLALGFGAYFSTVVLIPLWLQTNLLYTATWAGYVMAFNGVLAVAFSPVVARLMPRVNARELVSAGLVIMGLVTFLRVSFASNINFLAIAWPNLLQGAAIPFFFVPLTGLALSAVKPEETASAAGLANFMRTTAGAFGTSLITTRWDDASTHDKSELVGRLNGAGDLVTQLSGQGFTPAQATSQLDTLVNAQATMTATTHMFGFAALVLLAGGAAIWLAPKPRGPVAAGSH
jgi:DHA2 family multidrug resistance protein